MKPVTALISLCIACLALPACNPASQRDEAQVLAEARSYLSQELYEQAESTLVSFQQTSALSAGGHALLGQAKAGLFDDDGAIENFRASLSVDADQLGVRLQLIRALRRSGLLEEAFGEIKDTDLMGSALFNYEAGQIRMQEGKFEEAVAYFEEALNADPQFVDGYYALGTAYQRVGRVEDGTALLERHKAMSEAESDVNLDAQIVELNPNSADAHYNLARAYEKQGDDPMAIAYYSQAIALDGDMREAYNNLGIVYFRTNEDEKAIQAFSKAISLSDTTAKYYFNLGAVYARRGVLTEAEKLWRKTLELDPNYQRAKDFLAQLEAAKQ